jgi:hypothetical protein
VVRNLVEVLARAYHGECGEPLVVTSLTRPATRQPDNASPLSVHPAGMAVDLRVSSRRACVRWLEAELLALESRGLLDATREYRPPHFHVAVFPEPFEAHLAQLAADSVRAAQALADSLQVRLERELLALQPPLPAIEVIAPSEPPLTPVVLLGDLLAWVGRLLLRV